jgi:prepilin-type N-terminal cleavage/methylation domain-containing protein
MTNDIRNDEHGFTLPELLVTMSLLAIVLAVFGQMVITTSNTSNRVREQATLQAETRASLDRLTTDLRQATTTTDVSPVGSVSGTAFTFDTPDRSTPFHLRRISYRLVNGTLERSTTLTTDSDGAPWVWPAATGPWIQELGSIRNASPFVFYDANSIATTTADSVRSLRVTLTVAPKQTQGGSNTYSTLVTIRTLS